MVILSGKLKRVGYRKLKDAECLSNITTETQWKDSLSNLTHQYETLIVKASCISKVSNKPRKVVQIII